MQAATSRVKEQTVNTAKRGPGWAALYAIAFMATATCATAGTLWPANGNMIDGATSPTISIGNSHLSVVKGYASTSNGATSFDHVPRGGAAVVVLPNITGAATSITASGLSVSGYTTSITAENATFDINAFGPLTVFGSKYAATASGMTGIASDDTSHTSAYVTNLTSASFTNVSLTGNTTTLKIVSHASTAGSSAFGGGARLANLPNLTYRGGTISNNTIAVVSTNSTPNSMDFVHANGGGMVIENDFGGTYAILGDLVFSKNTASVTATGANTDPGADSNARGGALYVAGYNNEKQTASSTAANNTGLAFRINDSVFTGNRAVNTGGAASGAAAGGAIFTNLAVKSIFQNVVFNGNSAESSHAGAMGGAVAMVFADRYSTGGSADGTLTPLLSRTGTGATYYADFNKATFSDNVAQGIGALGGAIYADKNILLSETTFSGNEVRNAAGVTQYRNAIHLQAGAEAIFYDVAGKKSTDNDGISGNGVIRKLGDGELELFGDYAANFSGSVAIDEGKAFFQGGTPQDFAGGITVAAGSTVSLERTALATAANVNASSITLANGSTVIARILKVGDGLMTNETAHFTADTVTGITGAANVYRVGGAIVEGEQYRIIVKNGIVLPGLTSGNAVETVNGLWGDYTVYNNSADAVWAEMNAGTARTLGNSADTVNNRSVANAIGPGSDNYEHIVAKGWTIQDRAALNEFFRKSNNEIGASTTSALINYTMRTATGIIGHSRDGWIWNAAQHAASASSNSGYAALNRVSRGPRIWASLDGHYSKGRDNKDTFKGKTRSYGVSVGMDKVWGDWMLGGGFRYGDGRLKVDALDSRADFDSYSFSVYGGRRFQFNPGALILTAGYSFGFHDIDSRRRDVAGGSYKSDYDGKSHTVFLDGEFSFATCGAWKLAPFANAIWNAYRNDSYTEKRSGGVTDALHVAARTQTNLTTTLGVRSEANLTPCLYVDAQVGWRHTYGNLTPSNRTNFVGQNNRFSVIGNSLARDEAVYGAGIGYKIGERAVIRASYDGSWGDKTYSHWGNISFSLWF